MSNIASATQKALYTALTAGSPAPVSAAVYDAVPQNAAYPYIVLDTQEAVNQDHLTERLDQQFYYISVWSRERGKKQVQSLMAQIHTALHNKRLSLDTGRMVICRVIRERAGLDADGITFMGSLTCEILVED